MKRDKAFSLAEALITLLIVCIIAIASAPMITKKARKAPATAMWQQDTTNKNAVTPTGMQDIRLGTDKNGSSQQGIVVVGKMYFKDRKGNVIGWIAEDGSTSFAQGNDYDFNAMSQKQEKLEQALITLSTLLEQEKQKNDSGYSDNSNYSQRSEKRSSRRSQRNNSNNMQESSSSQATPEDLQKQLEVLMKMMNTQNNR